MAKAGARCEPVLSSPAGWSAVVPAEDQRRIGAAETEGIRQRDVDIPLSRFVRNQIDVGLDGGVVEVNGRRRDAIADSESNFGVCSRLYTLCPCLA